MIVANITGFNPWSGQGRIKWDEGWFEYEYEEGEMWLATYEYGEVKCRWQCDKDLLGSATYQSRFNVDVEKETTPRRRNQVHRDRGDFILICFNTEISVSRFTPSRLSHLCLINLLHFFVIFVLVQHWCATAH